MRGSPLSRKRGLDQGLRIGLLRRTENFIGRTLLHQLAVLHHHDVVGHGADDGEVVADEEV